MRHGDQKWNRFMRNRDKKRRDRFMRHEESGSRMMEKVAGPCGSDAPRCGVERSGHQTLFRSGGLSGANGAVRAAVPQRCPPYLRPAAQSRQLSMRSATSTAAHVAIPPHRRLFAGQRLPPTSPTTHTSARRTRRYVFYSTLRPVPTHSWPSSLAARARRRRGRTACSTPHRSPWTPPVISA